MPCYSAGTPLRSAGHAAINFETQSFGGRLGIGMNGKVDEIGHADLPVYDVVDELRGDRVVSSAAIPAWSPQGPYIETPA
jgi:hypothetical protein